MTNSPILIINGTNGIIYRDNKFWCDVDEEECCAHVHFALALPELAELRSK